MKRGSPQGFPQTTEAAHERMQRESSIQDAALKRHLVDLYHDIYNPVYIVKTGYNMPIA
jgi:hypothetical protein